MFKEVDKLYNLILGLIEPSDIAKPRFDIGFYLKLFAFVERHKTEPPEVLVLAPCYHLVKGEYHQKPTQIHQLIHFAGVIVQVRSLHRNILLGQQWGDLVLKPSSVL
jgi:hypothetical protein